ncbi:MAG: DMT family transporter [Phenylobacterium sp.]|uniref:DMT family transporter n=1 Tax=Phenylobacterium sp. TaxID=1871053 RepID=UPI002733E795|nr:DMT family transporter [Phenylobacterium sp.]MDP3174456.1 DMT family transporter [Phenylobacterium sp.]
MSPGRQTMLTVAAMVAFAANSLLCRQALAHTSIDAASFTAIRLGSGALVLWAVVTARQRAPWPIGGSWISAAALFAYAACFSFAYETLTAATGALLLFAAVQFSMIAFGFASGTKLGRVQAVGFAVAAMGLVALLLPGVAAPSPKGALMMGAAGLAWGVYSLRSGSHDPAQTTAANFIRATPMALGLMLLFARDRSIDLPGAAFAVASGAGASGLGYVIWYAALRGMPVTTASIVQLSVPAIAAVLGVVLLGEAMSIRLVVASVVILTGIGLAARTARPARRPTTDE